jgi:hypothetical protein
MTKFEKALTVVGAALLGVLIIACAIVSGENGIEQRDSPRIVTGSRCLALMDTKMGDMTPMDLHDLELCKVILSER